MMSRRMSQPTRIGCALAAAGVLIATYAVWPGANKSGPPVEIVLPDGYTGPVYLIEDKANGTEIRLANGRYLVEMPGNCRLRVKTLEPFQHWHPEALRYANGTIVPDEKLVPNADPTRVMLRMSNCGVTDGGPVHIEMFVGTDKQVGEFIRGPRPPLN